MKIFKTVDELNKYLKQSNVALTMGNFDGVHLGHQSLINSIKKSVSSDNCKLGIVTFVPHPRVVLKGDIGFLINGYNERRNLLAELKIDFVLELKFDRDFSTQKPEDFLTNYIFKVNNLNSLYLGHDFAFGANKQGSFELVKQIGGERGVNVFLESEVVSNGGLRFSSTEIRQAVSDGDMPKASSLLGRSFYVSGSVVKGQGRGKKIGFPTANILIDNSRIIPRNGVYQTLTTFKGMVYQSITNVGVNPTFKDDKKTIVETNIFDFDEDIYGETIKVEFIDYIRDEKKFNSVNELVDQISIDVKNVKKVFKC